MNEQQEAIVPNIVKLELTGDIIEGDKVRIIQKGELICELTAVKDRLSVLEKIVFIQTKFGWN